MSIFGFGETIIKQPASATTGPLKALSTSSFFGSTLRYPIDIGNYDKGHYMVIYIREQIDSGSAQNAGIPDSAINVPTGPAGSSIGTATQNKLLLGSSALNKLSSAVTNTAAAIGKSVQSTMSGVSNLPSSIVKTPSLSAFSGSISESKLDLANGAQNFLKSNGATNSFIRTTQLTRDAIALYMPDTLLYQHNQAYDEPAIGNENLGQLLGGLRSYADNYGESKDTKKANSSAIKTAALFGLNKAAGAAGSTGKVLFTKATGAVVNPMLELIYTSPKFRTFQFDFTFYPRSESESLEVQKIIEKLRFHQAPEFYSETVGFLRPPSEFDIRFYYGGSINPNIPPLITCVLESIQVNYAPNGFATYEVPGDSGSLGGTGMPVAIQLSLSFKETSYLTKADFRNDSVGGTSSSAGNPPASSPSLNGVINTGGFTI